MNSRKSNPILIYKLFALILLFLYLTRTGKIYEEIFPLKSISCVTFFFCNSITGHFSGKFCSRCIPSSHTSSNDTGLKFASCPGAESIARTRIHTEQGCYNIDFCHQFLFTITIINYNLSFCLLKLIAAKGKRMTFQIVISFLNTIVFFITTSNNKLKMNENS
jgi:hypothetical protein